MKTKKCFAVYYAGTIIDYVYAASELAALKIARAKYAPGKHGEVTVEFDH